MKKNNIVFASFFIVSLIYATGCTHSDRNSTLNSSRIDSEDTTASTRKNITTSTSNFDFKSLSDTVGIEHDDRVKRLKRLATMEGVEKTQIDELQLPKGEIPGFDFKIPIVRVWFDERVFFDSGSAELLPEAYKIINVIADSMKNDVPDAQLSVLGHTDAIGSDEANFDLSSRRAATVITELINQGVNSAQLSSIAVGETQPIASNSTELGRALNRRVEFMVSVSEEANQKLVSRRRIIEDYLKLPTDVPSTKVKPPQTVDVLKPDSTTTRNAPIIFHTIKRLKLRSPEPASESRVNTTPQVQPTKTVEPKIVEPQSQNQPSTPIEPNPIRHIKPKDFHRTPLNEEFKLE